MLTYGIFEYARLSTVRPFMGLKSTENNRPLEGVNQLTDHGIRFHLDVLWLF
jgi:hypothetical protein